MTRTELKAQVSEAGKDFISKIDKGTYLPRWFDSQTFVDDMIVEDLVDEIDFYNKNINEWIKSGLMDVYRLPSYGSYGAIRGMLRILSAIGYYKYSEYGDILPFIDYCFSCWDTKQPISFAEYEKIRAFFEGREEVSQ